MLVNLIMVATMSVAQANPTAPIIAIRTPPPAISIQRIMTPSAALAAGVGEIAPAEAIMRAADAATAKKGVRAVFAMPVRRAQKVGKLFFLNSEADYRDQRNLSIEIGKDAYRVLRQRFGKDLSKVFVGQNVRVYGLARRVRIGFGINGRPTRLYYYQTHVFVSDPAQIEVVT